MYVIRHHDGSMKFDSFSVVVSAVLENQVAGIRWERIAIRLSESHEDCTAGLLVMWEAAPVIIVVGWNL
jgi:hypothetical protein